MKYRYWRLQSLLLTAGFGLRGEDKLLATAGAEDPRIPATVIYGNAESRSALSIPHALTSYGSNLVRNEQMAASVPEALLQTPSILVQQTARGQGSPIIRGFTGFRNVALVDGIRLNNSTFRDGPNQYWSTIDSLAIGQLDVIRGNQSVLFGGDAIGGVANATLSPLQYGVGEGVQGNGAAFYRYGSAEDANLGRVSYGQSRNGKWGYSVGVSGKTFGDLRGGRDVGLQPYSGYDQWDADLKGEWFLTDKSRFTIAFQRTQQEDVKRTHRTIYGPHWEGVASGTDKLHSFDQLRELLYGRLSHETERGDQLSATVSWHRQDEFQWVQKSNASYHANAVDVGTLGLKVQGISDSPVGQWTYGADSYTDHVGSSQKQYSSNGVFLSEEIQGPVADDSVYDLTGACLQDEVTLPGRVHWFFGGRYGYANANAGSVRDPISKKRVSLDQDWSRLMGSTQWLWHPDSAEKWSLFTGVSQGFRAPNLSDLTRFDTARSGELETAALGLRPEEFLSFELGAKVRQNRWSASVTGYRTEIKNLIVRTPTGNVVGGLLEVTKRNAAGGWVQGLEGDGDVVLGGDTKLFGSLAIQDGEADSYPTSSAVSVRGSMTRLAPLTGLVGLRWEPATTGFFTEFFVQMAARQDRLSADDLRDTQRIPPGGTPGWVTANLRLGYDWNQRLRIVGALENLTDEDYRIHGSGFNQPGRNAKASLEWRF